MTVSTKSQVFAKLEFAFLMIAVFFAPYAAFRHPATSFTLSDLFFVVAFLLRAVTGLPASPLGPATKYWLLGALMLLGGLLVSSVVNGDALRGLIVSLQYAFAYICLPFAVLWRPYDQSIRLMKCSVLSMAVICVIGIAVFYTGYRSGYVRQFNFVTAGGRLASFLDNPNGLAIHIVFVLPMLLFLTLSRQMKRGLFFIFIAIFLVALVLTSSNTGLFASFIVFSLFILGTGSFKLFVFSSIFLCAVAYSVVFWGEYFLPVTFQNRVLSAISSADVSGAGTFDVRYALVVESWRLAEKYVLLGMGANQYRVISELGLPVHNTYLILLNEGGIITLLGFVMMIAASLIAPVITRNQPFGGLILLCSISVVIAFSFSAMSSAHLYFRSIILMVLIGIGPAISLVRRPRGP